MKTLILKTVIFVCAVFVAVSSAFAEEQAEKKVVKLNSETVEAAKELMRTMNVRAIDATLEGMIKHNEKAFSEIVIPKGKEEMAEKLIEEAKKEIRAMVAWDRMEPKMIRVYAGVFTVDEMKELSAFFKTKVGTMFINKQPELSKAMSNAISETWIDMMPNFFESVQKVKEAIQGAE